NLLRLGHWLAHGRMPVAGVITGATNEAVDYFVRREHVDVCIRGYTNKNEAWQAFLDAFPATPEEVAFVYDDVLDLSMARHCGLRICVRRDGPAFNEFVSSKGFCDYRTGKPGGQGAVREVCELFLSLTGMFEHAVQTRIDYGTVYRDYLNARTAIDTHSVVRSPAH
ncbi:MAG: hypothetical protein R3330_17710, partial [Saprospiraceae bacterium]|nr:hypothetical protein [Saprospiraceae bacterium]